MRSMYRCSSRAGFLATSSSSLPPCSISPRVSLTADGRNVDSSSCSSVRTYFSVSFMSTTPRLGFLLEWLPPMSALLTSLRLLRRVPPGRTRARAPRETRDPR